MMGTIGSAGGSASSNAIVVYLLLLLSFICPLAADAAAFSAPCSSSLGAPSPRRHLPLHPRARTPTVSATRLRSAMHGGGAPGNRRPRDGDYPSSGAEADGGCRHHSPRLNDRRSFVNSFSLSLVSFGAVATMGSPGPATALVKGNAPPPKKARGEDSEGGRKCRNVEECQEMAERLASEEDARRKASATPLSTAPGGSRYMDLVEGGNGDASSTGAKPGDLATIRYRVLKLGKRSYDGLSGEGTVVFSRGYGLEDDEPKPGVASFRFRVGDPNVIAALSDGIQSMKVGGTRRIGVLPQMGWEKATKLCDGGPGGAGAGGDLKTDYVIVPTATMVATEGCFDKAKLPFPTTYAEERRMAQRFDQSLIIEVELVDIA